MDTSELAVILTEILSPVMFYLLKSDARSEEIIKGRLGKLTSETVLESWKIMGSRLISQPDAESALRNVTHRVIFPSKGENLTISCAEEIKKVLDADPVLASEIERFLNNRIAGDPTLRNLVEKIAGIPRPRAIKKGGKGGRPSPREQVPPSLSKMLSDFENSAGIPYYNLYYRISRREWVQYATASYVSPVVNTWFAHTEVPNNAVNPKMPLLGGTEYYFCVNVGELLPVSIEESPTRPPEVPAGARLTVALFSFPDGFGINAHSDTGELEIQEDGTAWVTRQPRPEFVWLPRDGFRDQVLVFTVRSPPAPSTARMRCNIYYNQILLQSRLITAKVVQELPPAPEPEYVLPENVLRSVIDYNLTNSMTTEYLSKLPEHKLSILLNENDDGTHSLHIFGKDEKEIFKTDSIHFRPTDLSDIIKTARTFLRMASWGYPEEHRIDTDKDYRYKNPAPQSQNFKDDIIMLARGGSEFYSTLFRKISASSGGSDRLKELIAEPSIIQIAMKESPSDILPAALLYDYPLDDSDPKAIRLCTTFEKALQNGSDFDKIPCFKGQCPCRTDSNRKEVCPSGFWGFRHELGMPVSVKGAPEAPATIPVTGSDLKMTMSVATTISGLDTHKAFFDHNITPVIYTDNRKDTFEALRKSPHIVYFLCHGFYSDIGKFPYIVVGTNEAIFESDLSKQNIVWQSPRPLVFLNGCHTTAVDPLKAFNFIEPLISDCQCAGVIGTEITIFPELAKPFAEECLKRFAAGERIGMALRNTRLTRLKKGDPLGLVYILFAQAGLRLEKSESVSIS